MEWTLTSLKNGGNNSILYINDLGDILHWDNTHPDYLAHNALLVRPATYLIKEVKIIGGRGTVEEPYLLSK